MNQKQMDAWVSSQMNSVTGEEQIAAIIYNEEREALEVIANNLKAIHSTLAINAEMISDDVIGYKVLKVYVVQVNPEEAVDDNESVNGNGKEN